MSLTLENAITQVRSAINESTASYWSDDEITFWIQEGTRIFSSKTLMVEDTQDIDPLIENQLRYTLSDETWIANIIEPYAALYDDGSNKTKGLIKVHPRQLGNVATFTSGAPKYYALHNRSLYIWPLTTAAITDEYKHLPIIYATAKCQLKDQKYAEFITLLQQYYNEVNFERSDKHNRETDSFDMFKTKVQSGGRANAPGS